MSTAELVNIIAIVLILYLIVKVALLRISLKRTTPVRSTKTELVIRLLGILDTVEYVHYRGTQVEIVGTLRYVMTWNNILSIIDDGKLIYRCDLTNLNDFRSVTETVHTAFVNAWSQTE